MTTTDTTSREEFTAMWRRQQPAWHAAVAFVWLAAVVVTVVDDPGPYGRVPSLALLGLMAAAYLGLGVRAMAHENVAFAVAYHVVVWSALLAIQWVDPGTQSWLLFFALFPQLWAMLPARWATIATVVVVTAFSLVRWAQLEFDRDSATEILISGTISMGLSLSLGLFINRIITEAESRAETIDELRATQDRLATAERVRGVHEERERLSREIHDTLAQGFTSVVALSRAADAALARGDLVAARDRLALIEATASDNLDEARLIVAELTPGHLQSRTLVEAVERLGATVETASGVPTDVRVEGDPVPLGGTAEVVILRTAQEALSNVRRHSGAAHVGVTLTYADPLRVVLEVRDDGVGFDTAGARSGFGLDGLFARAAEVGGAVDVRSRPGAGTTLRLEVPR
ncbi:sensor histidine kinase [Oryzobacter telluris]|uniref:sensor histidine kinase n=1 Tax=Oryzobacter telluris TaxID=3149179 RepID=UPI00370D9B7B